MVAPYPAPRRFPEFPTTAQRRQRPGSHKPYGDLPGITCEYSRDLFKLDWIQAPQEMNRNNPNGSSHLIVKMHPSSHYWGEFFMRNENYMRPVGPQGAKLSCRNIQPHKSTALHWESDWTHTQKSRLINKEWLNRQSNKDNLFPSSFAHECEVRMRLIWKCWDHGKVN